MYGMKTGVVYNQAWGFHRAVRKFVAKFQITFPNLAVCDGDQLEVPTSDSKFSFARLFGCAKVIIGNRKLINPMFS